MIAVRPLFAYSCNIMSMTSEEPSGERPPKTETEQQPSRAQARDFFDEEVEIVGLEPFELPFVEAITKIHKTQDLILEALCEHLAELPDSNTEAINKLLAILVDDHGVVLSQIFGPEDANIDVAVREYAAHMFVLNKDLHRELSLILEELHAHIDCDDSAAEFESVLWEIHGHSESKLEFVTYLQQAFTDGRGRSLQIVLDSYEACGHGIERHDMVTPKERALKIATHIGKSAQTAFVIAAGVAGGLIVAQKFINRK